MRTLIVDNYDSFTFNLAHYVAQVTGAEPTVIRNDDPTWHPSLLDAYDSVILSPGPGTPARGGDVGICRDAVERGGLPVLGVCLGHQAIALWHGARVGRAPAPHHGRLSPVLHDGTDLFAGLTAPFTAVRYHSLAVTDLPDELEATAHTPDGILMGLRHRHRPLWGVQFHPESICTDHGHDLLANFARLAREHRARRNLPVRRTAVPATAAAPRKPDRAVAAKRQLKLLNEQLTTRWDAETVYDRLFRTSPYAFWLDSSRRDGATGRFTMMGDASGPLARVATADVWNGTVTVTSATGCHTERAAFLDWLDADLRSLNTRLPPLPGDFALGWVGALGYELKAECGGRRAHRSEDPDAAMIFADRAIVIDHLMGTTHLLALAENDEETAATRWLDTTATRLRRLATEPPLPPPVPDFSPPLTDVTLRHDREAYLALIDRCHEEIAAGETYEVCLTNMITASGPLDPWQAYRRLRRTSPAPFAALLSFGADLSVLSTSPERFLRISADGVAESRPIKGTRPRGTSEAEDRSLIADLRGSEKDRAENLMIVDLVRNDLARTARAGTVTADEIFQIESYTTVHQLVSTVRARLREDASAVDCVRAAFPGGSMTGAPKLRTMELIDDLEQGPRGLYSGALGYFSLSGAADLSIVIRTLVASPDRVRYGVGGAVIALSDAADEFEETAVKARPLLSLTREEFPGRTLEPTP
ncbi:aminodeoxychorismate synthase component I [Streptomyces sp. NPDC127039]|uniref:aminodeoxychorismate synthase component I n=1 Tax=Streptomyces sp. NPDC127039 TaxID=3347115 RepID=UPI00364BF89D